MSKLQDRVALVTGASKGIGASIARHLAAAGATVVVNYAKDGAGAERVVADIAAAGGKAFALQGDFSKRADIRRIYATIADKHGRLDVLVNNAGVYSFGPVEQTTEEEFHRQFDLNVLGLLLATGEALPLFGERGGSVINIGSLVGSMPPPHTAIYSATKGAVDNLTVSLAKELGPRKIRVNALNPGMVKTEGVVAAGMHEGEFADKIVAATPLGRLGAPDDIGPVAVFLASEDAHWVTGQLLLVGGGATF